MLTNDVLGAALEGLGLYDLRRFVVRLSDEMHRRLQDLPVGMVQGGLQPEELLAHSVYLHETWHWWQHVGSTFGFLSSLVYPAQTQTNLKYLKDLLGVFGPVKSVQRLIELSDDRGGPDSRMALPNIIVNNFADFRFYQALCSHPEKVKLIVNNPFYESKGHAFGRTYMNIVSMLARSADRNFETLPDPRRWEGHFEQLRASRKRNHFIHSPIDVPPVGAFKIFEGQCRYNQLVYLDIVSGGTFGWQQAEARGMFLKPYDEAFQVFLTIIGEARPVSISSPVVGLFLLICDIALNPTTGFPCDIDFETDFLAAADPGIRFFELCKAAAKRKPKFAHAIENFSKEEYCEVGQSLADDCGYAGPLVSTRTVCQWIRSSAELRQIADMQQSFVFPPENQAVAFLLSHFLQFSKDKNDFPEFFCWPGKYLAGSKLTQTIADLFEKHGAPFINSASDGGIYPRLRSGLSKDGLHKAFLAFYQYNVVYDLTEQWVLRPGPFDYDLSWLSSASSAEELRQFAQRGFQGAFGVALESFNIL